MGGPMARNLVDAGLDVRVWNRTTEKAREVGGADVHETPQEAAASADLVVTMLAGGGGAGGRAWRRGRGHAAQARDQQLARDPGGGPRGDDGVLGGDRCRSRALPRDDRGRTDRPRLRAAQGQDDGRPEV